MANNLSFHQLRIANLTRCRKWYFPLHSWSESDWLCGAAGELGEAANLIAKRRRGDDVSVTQVAEELADTVIYVDLLAARMGIDLGDAVRRKFNKTSEKRGADVMLD